MISVTALSLVTGLLGCGALASHNATENNLRSILSSENRHVRITNTAMPFQHKIWWHNRPQDADPNHDHTAVVYLHGDGRPWLAKGIIAADPSPLYSLTWSMMQLDHRPSFFISRPCYFELANVDPLCHPQHWTSARYSAAIVESLARSIEHTAQMNQFDQLHLVGYSGGASLAMLIAHYFQTEQISLVGSITTIAGNLDIDAWVAHHDYSPLKDSLNPAVSPKLPNTIEQHHFCGRADPNVPAKLATAFFNKQEQHCRMIDANHQRGWTQFWAQHLSNLRD